MKRNLKTIGESWLNMINYIVYAGWFNPEMLTVTNTYFSTFFLEYFLFAFEFGYTIQY